MISPGCCSDSKRVDGLGGVERAPFEPLRTARLFPDAIAWTSRFHRRVVRQDAAHAATEIVAHLRLFAEGRGCKACHKSCSPDIQRPGVTNGSQPSSDGRALVRRPCARPTAESSSEGADPPSEGPRASAEERRPRPEGAEGAEGATDPPQSASSWARSSRSRSEV